MDSIRGSKSVLFQADFVELGLAAKQATDRPSPMLEEGGPLHPNDPDADQGKQALAHTERDTAPSGAFDHAGERPARERSNAR